MIITIVINIAQSRETLRSSVLLITTIGINIAQSRETLRSRGGLCAAGLFSGKRAVLGKMGSFGENGKFSGKRVEMGRFRGCFKGVLLHFRSCVVAL